MSMIKNNVDPMIIANMLERLNPRKEFSYSNGDHLKQGENDERRMREQSVCDNREKHRSLSNDNITKRTRGRNNRNEAE